MSCTKSNSCRAVAKINKTGSIKRPNVECALRDGNIEDRVEQMHDQAISQFQQNMTVYIDYANEYLTRTRESDLGTLAFFIVDDLLDTLNLDATRAIFTAESGFKLKKVKDADTIRHMYHLAEHVKLLDTVAEKTLEWYVRQQQQCLGKVQMDEHVWSIWEMLNLSNYIRLYKEMYEGMPGDEARQHYENTSLHATLHHCHPERTAQVIEYTVSNAEPAPICAQNGSCKGNGSKKISNSSLRQAAQTSVRKKSTACSKRSKC